MAVSTKIAAGAAAALCLAAAVPAHAQSSVKLYGVLDLNAGQFQNAGGLKRKQINSGDFTTSFIGFTGVEDLGGGLAANFALDSFLRADTGRSGRVANDVGANTDVFWGRNANIGLAGAFGSTKLGRMATPLFVSSLIFNPFGDSFGFSPTIRQYFTAAVIGDTAWSNAARYETPSFNGFTASVMGSLGEGGAKSVGKNFGANLLYLAGPFGATLAYQKVKSDYDFRFGSTLPAGFVDQTTWQAGASYDLGVVKFFAQYGQVKTDIAVDAKAKIYQLGASLPVGAGKILGSYGYSKYSGPAAGQPIGYIFNSTIGAPQRVGTSKVITVGYDYDLSKRTDIYAVFLNDKYTNLSSGNNLAFGLRHRF